MLGTVEKGTALTRTGTTEDGWSSIDYNGTPAYVKSDYVSTEAPAQEPSADTSGIAAGTKITLTNTVNIRSSMSETASKVGVAYAGNAICKTFEIDIKKQIAKMIAKRKAEQKRKAEEAAAAKEMSQVTESTTTEASEDEKVSDDTMPTMLSEEDRKKLKDAVSKADFEEKTMQDSKAEAIEKTADSDSTENEAAEKTVSEEKVESVEKLATTTESEETPDEEIKAEETATEETSVQEELTDTRVVDIFAELNEEPVSEDAENDFEEK